MKKIIIYFLILTFLTYSGCATIFTGSNETVSLSSEPSGAKVLVNGNDEGKTPLALKLKKGKEYSIEFVKDGFESKSFRLTYSIGAGWIILDILCGIVGVVVDAVTGNWNSFDQNYYKANLSPKAESR